jgi:hypothetical protein
MLTNSKLTLRGIAARCGLLLCALSALQAACHYAPEAEPSVNATTAVEGSEACIETPPHAVTTARSCDERTSVSCTPEPDLESGASEALGRILEECFLYENILRVEFERGCATRFGLSLEHEGSVDCVAARLAAVRYDCFGDLSCGEGLRSTLR